MRGGKLRRVVSIQSATLATDAMGTPQPTWTNFVAKCYAQISEAGGKETIQANQINAQQVITVTIRYVAGITPKMRVVYGSRVFEIMTVTNINERNRELDLACLERQ